MKTLSILILTLLFISCEQTATGSIEEGTTSVSTSASGSDISDQFYGTYKTTCGRGQLEMGFGYERIITVDANGATLTYNEYGEAQCMTLTATRTYTIAFEVVATLNNDGSTKEMISIEHLESKVTLKHSAWDGYDKCGFSISKDIEYTLNSPCLINLTGTVEKFLVSSRDETALNLIESQGNVTFTKQ